MITYQEAFEIATTKRDHIDRCFEYERGWSFNNKDDEKYDGGYGHTSVCVSRDNGQTYATSYFLMIYRAGKLLKGFNVDPETGEPVKELNIDPESGAILEDA